MAIWTNSDGLVVKLHEAEATLSKGGALPPAGPTEIVQVELDLATAGASAAVVDQAIVIPAGMRIDRVELFTETAATSGGAAVLNVGLVRLDRTTELDYDGFAAAVALSTINAAGKRVTLDVGSTGAGALIGTTLANAGVLTFDYDTAAFTAGRIQVRVSMYRP